MNRINYFANCPCCNKVHVISVERSFETQLELDNAALSLCTCPAAHIRKDVNCAKERRENGFLDLAKAASISVGGSDG